MTDVAAEDTRVHANNTDVKQLCGTLKAFIVHLRDSVPPDCQREDQTLSSGETVTYVLN